MKLNNMTRKDIEQRIKELYKMKGKTTGERYQINKELIYLEMQLERIINNN